MPAPTTNHAELAWRTQKWQQLWARLLAPTEEDQPADVEPSAPPEDRASTLGEAPRP